MGAGARPAACHRGLHVMKLALARNMGGLDRLVRFYLGLVMIGFALPFWAPQTGWNWLGWFGLVPVLSALVGRCGVYGLIGLSTSAR